MIESTADNKESTAIIRVWQRLARLRALSFSAEPGPASDTGWRGSGNAEIAARPAGDDWRIVERGYFTAQGAARAVAFGNVYRWQRAGDRLRLYHERFGADNAVFLLELVAQDRQHLVCTQPHACGADAYHARLRLTDTGFDLDWSITGPLKDEHLFYRYRS